MKCMLKTVKFFSFGVALCLMTGCAPASDPLNSGPRLLQDVALDATTPAATRVLSPTPDVPTTTPEIISAVIGDLNDGSAAAPNPTVGLTSERISPLQVVTVAADFVIVTPTLPPSKTPTATPTITVTPSITLTPTITVTATTTAPIFPTSVIFPVTAPVINPIPQVCDSTWGYIQPPPEGCPLAPPTASQAVYQTFEYGHMVWVGFLDEIFVLYSDNFAVMPRWSRFRDSFEEGEPESDPGYANPPSSNLWQPRRGFGELWRDDMFKTQVRDRVGWATMEWEQGFSTQYQQGRETGSIFITRPDGAVFGLHPSGTWTLHSSAPFSGGVPAPTQQGGLIPLP